MTSALLTASLASLLACARDSLPEQQASAVAPAPRRSTLIDSTVRTALRHPGAELEYRRVLAETRDSLHHPDAVWDLGTHSWLLLSDTVLLDLTAVDSILTTVAPQGATLALRVALPAADRILSSTNRHTGGRIAILLNGEILQALGIGGPWAGYVPLVHGLAPPLATELRDRLQAHLRS